MSREYTMGLAFGILTALIILLIFRKFSKKKMKGQFDERQELVRGRGYKYACFTLLGLVTLDLLIESLGAYETLPVTRELALFFMILVCIMVYALYCIKNDSYFGVGTDARTYRAVMWIVIVCNAVSAFSGFRSGAVVDGKLSFGPFASLLFCIAFCIIMITLTVKGRSAADDESEDEI
ncbi:MAG: hypothetical protein IJJ31_02905 [Mogibacterium sp.]|nr:hypothetical protein [Mogibacterium sp.]